MSRNALLTVLLSTGLCMSAGSAAAQQDRPGWIGISFDVRPIGDARRTHTGVVITEVHSDSPAAEADVRAGDVLLGINDLRTSDELQDVSQRLRLRAGDHVRLLLERNGTRRELDLLATERPDDVGQLQSLTFAFQPDSMIESIARAMDSLRVRVELDAGRTFLRVGRAPGPDGPEFPVDESSWVQAPFEFFVFRGAQYDSLRREMEGLNTVLRDLQVRERELARESGAAAPGGSRTAPAEVELRRLRETQARVSARATQLRAAMTEDARAGAGLAYAMPSVAARPGAAPPLEIEEFRPLTPYLLGRNRVAGAEVIDLRPELAAYFEVSGGVLVVDVPDETPAALAGLRPGDVITRVDRTSVRSVDDLRLGVTRAEGTVALTLMRRGESLQVLLPR